MNARIDDTLPSSSCFAETLLHLFAERHKLRLSTDGVVAAAVLAPLFKKNGRCHVLLTKRSTHVEHHKGEISFPGGKLDACDKNLLTCALRETTEEIGVQRKDVTVLGELDDFYTVATHYVVTPFVGLIPYPYDFQISAREIECLVSVPLDVFFDLRARTEHVVTVDGRDYHVVSYQYEDHVIWGATARILKHLVDLITERDVRGVFLADTKEKFSCEQLKI